MSSPAEALVCAFPSVPDELLEVVFAHLPLAARKNLRLCCEGFRSIVDRSIKHINVEMQQPQMAHRNAGLEVWQHFISRLVFLRSLSCSGVSSSTASELGAILPRLHHISELNICLGTGDAEVLHNFPAYTLRSLTTLTITSAARHMVPLSLEPLAVCLRIHSLCIEWKLLTPHAPHEPVAIATAQAFNTHAISNPLVVLSHLPTLSHLALVDELAPDYTSLKQLPTTNNSSNPFSTTYTLQLPSLPHVTHLTIPSTPGFLSTLSNCSSLVNLHVFQSSHLPSHHHIPPANFTLTALTTLCAPSKLHRHLCSISPHLQCLTLDFNDGGCICKTDLLQLPSLASLTVEVNMLNNRVMASILNLHDLPSLEAVSLHFAKLHDPRLLSVLKVTEGVKNLNVRICKKTHFSPARTTADYMYLHFLANVFDNWELHKDDMLRHYEDDMILAALGGVLERSSKLKIWLQSDSDIVEVSNENIDPVMKYLITDSVTGLEALIASIG